tara:strand:- start:1035 stop:3251 length:2217 start_codon:yes stop_codon:yes gene_type:complete
MNKKNIIFENINNLIAQEKYNEAIDLLKKNIEQNKSISRSYYYLSEISHLQGKNNESHSSLLKAIKCENVYWEADYKYANYLNNQQKYEDSIIHYNAALSNGGKSFNILTNLSIAQLLSGKHDDAFKSLDEAEKFESNSARIYDLRGAIFMAMNDNDKAISALEKAVNIDPNLPYSFHRLGKCYRNKGDIKQSVNNYKKAISLDNQQALFYIDLATLYLKSGHVQDALTNYKLAEKINPNDPLILNNIGTCYTNLKETQEAIRYFDKAIKIDENYDNAYINKSVILTSIGLYDQALELLNKSLKINDKSSEAYNNMGLTYYGKNEPNKAIEFYEKAIQLDPTLLRAYRNLSVAHFTSGDKNKAAEILFKLLKIAPNDDEAFRNLVINKGITGKHKIAKHFENRFYAIEDKIKDLPVHEIPQPLKHAQIETGFGLGSLFDSENDYDKAFKFFQRANDLQRSNINYDIKIEESLFNQIKSAFNKSVLNNQELNGNDSKAPIFVVGMPRSGTSMIEQILASHSEVYGAGELNEIKDIANTSLKFLKNNSVDNIGDLTSNERIKFGGEYIERINSILSKDSSNKAANRIVDKQVYNFIYIGFIKMILPNAKIIHIERNPLDTCLSIYTLKFVGHHAYAYSLKDLGGYYNLYKDMMRHWSDVIPGHILNIKYENVVDELEKNVRKILDFCHLDFEKECIDFHKTKRYVQTSSALQVKEKLYTSSVDRWKSYEQNLDELKGLIN